MIFPKERRRDKEKVAELASKLRKANKTIQGLKGERDEYKGKAKKAEAKLRDSGVSGLRAALFQESYSILTRTHFIYCPVTKMRYEEMKNYELP